MTTPEPTDAELDVMEAELRRDLEAAIVDLLLLQMRAVHEPPVDLATSLAWRDQTRRLAELLGHEPEEWDVTELLGKGNDGQDGE
jgi:hypothetical protein